jgi:3D-(3,5/4)-trihydroxycyclohexane-1,2-dione acylhydrolase (decyclizing)
MGYEIAGGLGVRRAAPDRDVIVLVGDGSYLMLHTELVTAVAEGLKIVVVLLQNHGYASIGHLSETVGSERFGTAYRYLDPSTLDFQNEQRLPIDLAANARSYGVDVIEVRPGPDAVADLRAAVAAAKASDRTTLIHVETDPLVYAPDGEGWWDVPVAAVSALETTRAARRDYDEHRTRQKPLLG